MGCGFVFMVWKVKLNFVVIYLVFLCIIMYFNYYILHNQIALIHSLLKKKTPQVKKMLSNNY